jgi:hypothetical protein
MVRRATGILTALMIKHHRSVRPSEFQRSSQADLMSLPLKQPQRVHRGVHDCVAFLRRGIRIQNLAVFAETLGTAASHCDSPSPCGFRQVNADAVLCCYLLQIGLVWILALLGTGLDI